MKANKFREVLELIIKILLVALVFYVSLKVVQFILPYIVAGIITLIVIAIFKYKGFTLFKKKD